MPREDTQFKPGQSGNPAGRPKKDFCIPDILRKISDEDGNKDMTKLEAVLRVAYQKAAQGDLRAIQFIAERLEGKPHQSTSVKAEVVQESPLKGFSTDELRTMAGLDPKPSET